MALKPWFWLVLQTHEDYTGKFFSELIILQNRYTNFFLPTFQIISKKEWVEVLFFFFQSLFLKGLYNHQGWKLAKWYLLFFENIVSEKNLPVIQRVEHHVTRDIAPKWQMGTITKQKILVAWWLVTSWTLSFKARGQKITITKNSRWPHFFFLFLVFRYHSRNSWL